MIDLVYKNSNSDKFNVHFWNETEMKTIVLTLREKQEIGEWSEPSTTTIGRVTFIFEI